MKQFVVVLFAVTAVWCVATVAPLAAPATSRSAVTNGQIAWKGFDGSEIGTGTWAIYAANPDGSHRRVVTRPGTGMHDDLPDWSPDGSKIVFERIFQPDNNSASVADEIMVVSADGRGAHQIGDCTGQCLGNDDPQYSPNGQQIVFTRAVGIGASGTAVLGVWVMDADGGNPQQITQLSADQRSEDHEPAWSPDGKNIVFTRLNDTAAPVNKQALFIVSSGGGTPRRVTPWKLNAGGANWAPNGSRILFQSYRDCVCSGTSQVYSIAPDGTRLRELTKAGRNIEPNWSPNGKKIVYAHGPGVGKYLFPDLWVMDANGKHKHASITSPRWEGEPDWGTAPLRR